MKLLPCVALSVLSGCMASSQTLLACDTLQTMTSAHNGFLVNGYERPESNPVLGTHPGMPEVAIWMTFAEVFLLAANASLPPIPRRIFHTVFTLAELNAVSSNWPHSGGWCMVR